MGIVRRTSRGLLVALFAVTLIGVPASQAALRAPGLQSPSSEVAVQDLPTFTWGPVAGAARYEFELAADQRFGSIALGTGLGKGEFSTRNTAAALDDTVPDGKYYWRVRAINAKDKAGTWSSTRTITKAWTSSPQLLGPDALSVSWPSVPLVLRWSTVPHAFKYLLTVATDPALANAVIGTPTQPQETNGTNFAVPGPLATGTYYWAVTPEDASGHRGMRSRIASFSWFWPTTTTPQVVNLNPDPRVFDPQFSWNPVPGAAAYEVEVNSAADFPAGSKWCCSDRTIGTSLSPTQVLGNNGYYWRVRALDARGNAGVWNYGPPFTKAFDNIAPTIRNLTVRDAHGNALAGEPTTDTPIVTWDPVPGASRYEVQLAPYSGAGCDWSQAANNSNLQGNTATTAWTPMAPAPRVGATAWPGPQTDNPALPAGNAQYCVRVLARSDNDAHGAQVISDWTQLNGVNQPAFTFASPPPPGPPASPLVMPDGAYLMPAAGSSTPRTPYFTWSRVSGATGYYVVIARDSGFTQVVDVAFTDVPAYAPRLANGEPLSDQTDAYYWAVIPAIQDNSGTHVYSDPAQGQDNPKSFNKASVPPTPLGPANGSNINTQPTFSWTSAENARNYRLQVSQDPTFGNPIDDVTTDATAYTSSSTYPADTTLYWRVRANDWTGQGLNWAPTQTFVRSLPIPGLVAGNATGGEDIPALSWSAVQGALSYDIHIDQTDGSTRDFNVDSTSFTPTEWYGVGIWRWKVRANFPTNGFGSVSGGYFPAQTYVRTLNPPTNAAGTKTGSRLVISWDPDPAAKQYQVDVSTTDAFGSTVDSHRTASTSWAPDIDFTSAANKRLLYWRVAAIDGRGNVGTFTTGSFGPPGKARCGTTSARKSHKRRRHKAAKRCVAKRPHKGGKHKRRRHK